MSLIAFVRDKITGVNTLGWLVSFIGTIAALDYFYITYWKSSDLNAVTWAASSTLALYSFIGLFNYCSFSQLKMQDEIDRVTKIKARLETQFLKKRQSSKGRK